MQSQRTSMQQRQDALVGRIVAASEPFGQAMIAVANKIEGHHGLLEKALLLREQYAKKDASHTDEYQQKMKELFSENRLDLSSDERKAAVGYLNLRAQLPEFRKNINSFKALVASAANDYLGALSENPPIPERIEAAKGTLKTSIVAGQLDTGAASVILMNAMRGQSPASGVGGPG